MDQLISTVLRAVEAGATTTKDIVDATGLSRLKVERSLKTMQRQKLLVRNGHGFRTTASPHTSQPRQCGSCNLCCDILEVAQVGKPENELCRHWETGTGCTIYEDRPQMCRSFTCAWLQGHLDDAWLPEKARMVVHFSGDAVNVHVDPTVPERWREEPYFSKLSEWSLTGIRRTGNPGYATLIVVGPARFLLLGRTAVPDPTPLGTAFMPLTPETFHYWKATSAEHLQRLNDRIAEIQRIREEFGHCTLPQDDDPYPPYRPDLLKLSNISSVDSA